MLLVVASGKLDQHDGPATAYFNFESPSTLVAFAQVAGRATCRSPRATHSVSNLNFKGCWQFCSRGILAFGSSARGNLYAGAHGTFNPDFERICTVVATNARRHQLRDGITHSWNGTQSSGFSRSVSASWHIYFSSSFSVFRMIHDYFE